MWRPFTRRRSRVPGQTHTGQDAEAEAVEMRSFSTDSIEPQRVDVVDDAASSINIDDEALNEDGSELMSTARRIIESSINWRTGRNEFDEYTVDAARRVLENAPKQRHIFGDDSRREPNYRAGVPSSSKTMAESNGSEFAPPMNPPMYPARSSLRELPGFSDGFYNEAPSDASSIFTMNIDTEELPTSQTMRLARSFRPNDFKWLCLIGGVQLGLLVATSNCISVSGPLGTLLGFLIVIPGVLSVMSSLSEMIAFFPMEGGFPLLVSAYVERSLGFAVGVCYWVACALMIPAEVLKTLRLLSFYVVMDNDSNTRVVWLTFVLGVLFSFSCLTTRMASWSLRLASMTTFGCLSVLLVFMWVLDAGGVANVPAIGFRHWRHAFQEHHYTKENGSVEYLFQTWHAVAVALEAYSGVEIPYTAMPEIRNPRRTVKSSMRLITIRVAVIYLLVVFSFTLVTSPMALNYFSNRANKLLCSTNISVVLNMFSEGVFCTFLLSLSGSGLCSVAYVLNAFFVYQGLFSAGLKLFGATRTLHGLGISGLMWEKLAWCTRDNVPVVAAAVSLSILLFGYLIAGVDEAKLFAFLTTFSIQMFLLVWVGLCIAYLRFYKAIYLQQPHTRISRNDEDYPYKSLWQPWTTWFGLLWCCIMILLVAFERQIYTSSWNGTNFVAGFLPIGIFVGLYLAYRLWFHTSPIAYEEIGLVSAKRQMDSEEWEEDRVYSDGFREKLTRRLNRWLA